MKVQQEVPTKGLEVWGILWKDAHWDSGEYESHEIVHRPVNYVSIGIILRDDAEGITIATDICETGSFRGLNFIPVEMILKKWKVGVVAANPRSRPKPKPLAKSAQVVTPTTEDKQSTEPA